MNDIILSMVEKKTVANEVIIREGEDGDNFYVIEQGTYVALKDGEQKFIYDNKGAFGELALMYNCPRAATVRVSHIHKTEEPAILFLVMLPIVIPQVQLGLQWSASFSPDHSLNTFLTNIQSQAHELSFTGQGETDGLLWAVDRVTFRNIIVLSMAQKRQKYEAILEQMDMFSGLTIENRAVIADCLAAEIFDEGEHILKEGEALQTDAKFYIVEKGIIDCYKTFDVRPTSTLLKAS